MKIYLLSTVWSIAINGCMTIVPWLIDRTYAYNEWSMLICTLPLLQDLLIHTNLPGSMWIWVCLLWDLYYINLMCYLSTLILFVFVGHLHICICSNAKWAQVHEDQCYELSILTPLTSLHNTNERNETRERNPTIYTHKFYPSNRTVNLM